MAASTAINKLATRRKQTALTAEQSGWAKATHHFLRQRISMVAALLLIALCLAALLAPSVAPYDPAEQFRDAGIMGQPLAPDAALLVGHGQPAPRSLEPSDLRCTALRSALDWVPAY